MYIWNGTSSEQIFVFETGKSGAVSDYCLNNSGQACWSYDGNTYFWDGHNIQNLTLEFGCFISTPVIMDNGGIVGPYQDKLALFMDGEISIISENGPFERIQVNNNLQIVWTSDELDGRAIFFANPVPEPATLIIFALGGLMLKRRGGK